MIESAEIEPTQCYHCQRPIAPTDATCPSCRAALILQQRYRLQGVLGRGGFGIVFEAIELPLNRRCAIKCVSATSQTEQRQIESEARILAHQAAALPFVPDIYTIWSDGPQTYLVMEYIQGQTLDL